MKFLLIYVRSFDFFPQVWCIFEGDIAIIIIDNVEFPLDSHLCMCQSLAKVAANLKFPARLKFNLTCHEDPSCLSVNCKIQQVPGTSLSFLFDPCNETVYVDAFNSSGSSTVEEDIFDRNESRPFYEDGVDFVIDVILINHNYSMTFQVQHIYSCNLYIINFNSWM